MIETLSPFEEKRILRGIEKAIAYTRSGSSPDEALTKVAVEYNFTPEIIKRSCEAFNKSKTVFYLEKQSAATRAESFPLADANKVIDHIYGHEKQAASILPRGDFTSMDLVQELRKTASEEEKASVKDEFDPALPGSEGKDTRKTEAQPTAVDTKEDKSQNPRGYKSPSGSQYFFTDNPESQALWEKIKNDPYKDYSNELEAAANKDHITKKAAGNLMEQRKDQTARLAMLDKFAHAKGEYGVAKEAAQQAIFKAAAQFGSMPVKDMQKAARLVVNRFGDEGAKLIHVIEAKLRKDIPFQKTASLAIFPPEEPYISVTQAMEAATRYRKAMDSLHKVADESRDFFFSKSAAPAGWLGRGIGGVLGAGSGATVEGLTGVTQQARDQMMTWLDIAAKSGKDRDVVNKFMTPDFLNNLRSIDAQQSWVAAAADPFVKNYPIEDITNAYNSVIAVDPSMEEPRNRPFMLTMVKKLLAQKNVFDPADIAQMSQIAKNRAEAAKSTADMQDRKMRDLVGSTEFIQGSSSLQDVLPMSALTSSIDTNIKGGIGGLLGAVKAEDMSPEGLAARERATLEARKAEGLIAEPAKPRTPAEMAAEEKAIRDARLSEGLIERPKSRKEQAIQKLQDQLAELGVQTGRDPDTMHGRDDRTKLFELQKLEREQRNKRSIEESNVDLNSAFERAQAAEKASVAANFGRDTVPKNKFPY